MKNRKYKKPDIGKDFLIEHYVNKNMTARDVARLLACHHMYVIDKLNFFKIPIKTRGNCISLQNIGKKKPKMSEIKSQRLDSILTPNFLYYEYFHLKKTPNEIAIDTNSSYGSVIRRIKKYKIPIRSHGEAISMSKIGKKLSKFHCQRISESMRGENNLNWKGGITDLRNKIRMLPESNIWHSFCLKRDLYVCRRCQNHSNLRVHHIKEFEKLFQDFLQAYHMFSPNDDKETLVRLAVWYTPFWDVDNGETVCDDCHRLIHNIKPRTRSTDHGNRDNYITSSKCKTSYK